MSRAENYDGSEDTLSRVDKTTGKGVSILGQAGRCWMVIQNNPEQYGVTLKSIEELLADACENGVIQYWAAIMEKSVEVKENGERTPHMHIIVYFPKKNRGSWLHKKFPHAALQLCAATMKSLRQYILKDEAGQWFIKHPEKAAEKLSEEEAQFYEWGDLPQGGNPIAPISSNMDIVAAIKAGKSDVELLEERADLWKRLPAVQQTRAAFLFEKYKNVYRENMQVIYVEGPTATGKTRRIMESHDYKIFTVDDYIHPWDGYTGDEAILMDEYRNQLRIRDMLRWLDRYPCHLPARYVNAVACYTTVYLASNWKLEQQYFDTQEKHPEDWNALLRRIDYRRVYYGINRYADYRKGNTVGEWVQILPSMVEEAPQYMQSVRQKDQTQQALPPPQLPTASQTPSAKDDIAFWWREE